MSEESKATFWDHTEELIRRLRVIFISVAFSSIFVSIFPLNFMELLNPNLLFHINPLRPFDVPYYPVITYVIHRLQRDLLPMDVQLIAVTWSDVITVYAFVALMLGVIVSFPVIVYEVYAFISPALLPHEKKFLFSFFASFLVLFVLGIVYAYYILVPLTFYFMLKLTYASGAQPVFSISSFFYFVSLALAGTGLFFTIPVFIVLLVKYEILEPSQLRGSWRMVLVGTLVFAAAVTPDPTPVSMSFMSVPFLALYALSVKVSEFLYGEREKKEKS